MKTEKIQGLLATYLNVQKEIKEVELKHSSSTAVVQRRLKKGCKTRWLSFDKAVDAIVKDLPAVLQTLRILKSDPACYGLLKKFQKPKKVGVLFILNDVLPVLSQLSKTFQKGTVNHAVM